MCWTMHLVKIKNPGQNPTVPVDRSYQGGKAASSCQILTNALASARENVEICTSRTTLYEYHVYMINKFNNRWLSYTENY